jgi:hypothetical protein
VKLTSWNDFRLIFGGFLPYSYLAYAVRGFFATGGQTCYVARVGVAATPPATAFTPLPAAITSTLIAHLSQSVEAAATQMPLDSVVNLSIGTPIAVGDPAVNPQRLTVASIIDSQNIVVQPGLLSGHDAGEPVFSLSGPAVAAPITFVTAANVSGATQIQVESTDVVEQGDLIAIGDPLTGECVSVMSLIDDQTITVQPPLVSIHAPGDAVYPALGSALAAAVSVNATVLQVASVAPFSQNDLVIVSGGGVSETRNIVGISTTASTIQVAMALQFPYLAGSVVRKYVAAITVNALSAGVWGNGIKLEVEPLDPGNSITHFSLRVTVDQGADPAQPQQQEFYPLLSLDPDDQFALQTYAPQVVNPVSQLIQICPGATPLCPGTIPQGTQLLVNSGPLQSGSLYLEGGSDGTAATQVVPAAAPVANPCWGPAAAAPPSASYQAWTSPPNASTQDFLDALDVLGCVDEIAILCCPEAAGPPPETPAANPWAMQLIQQAMVQQCVQLRYRVAVLDTPQFQAPGAPLQPAAALSWLNQQGYSEPGARFAAVYYPWLSVPDELGIAGPNRTVPPCGHVAGAYAYTDNQSGVQKPPANVELQFVSDVQVPVTSQQQALLNPAGINALRAFPGRGIRVWGARSISKNPQWVYIHTRRLMSMIEDSVEQATRWVVFRTNDDTLRRMLTHSLNVFLKTIWLTGGLQGATSDGGYFVKCDSTNNTMASIDAGQLICQVGVAIAAPMEFLVFEIRRSVAGAQVVEA